MSETEKSRWGVLASQVRVEEKMLFASLERRQVAYEHIDDRKLTVCLGAALPRYTAVLNRSIAYTRGLCATRLLEAGGLRVFNASTVIELCGDKLLTSLALVRAGLPTPPTIVAFARDQALEIVEALEYPVVLKPVTGSWGRLLARVNDRDALEALLEHKQMLRSPQHSIFYVQKYIEKKEGRDIRVIVIGDQVVCAMYRYSQHWITNTARGSEPVYCPLTSELVDLSLRAAQAVGGGILAVDLFEDDDALLVNEINHTPEFHGMVSATGVNVADAIIDYIEKEIQ